MEFHLGAHLLHSFRQTSRDELVGKSCAPQSRPEDAEVSTAVKQQAVNARFNAAHVAVRMMERLVMHGVAAVQESAVNIEQVGVRARNKPTAEERIVGWGRRNRSTRCGLDS